MFRFLLSALLALSIASIFAEVILAAEADRRVRVVVRRPRPAQTVIIRGR